MERGDIAALLPRRPTNRLLAACFAGPAHPVARRLREGETVADFTVIETPGHTPGHLSLWRDSDRTLILGDVLTNEHPITRCTGLREPFARFTLDPRRNRLSARKIAALAPQLICFGHGPPLRDPARLRAFVAALP
jgi:hydroxyacylglutathione hydrolase